MASSAMSQPAPQELRYKLDPGDRLVYRETFEKQGTSSDTTFHIRVLFSNQLMVLDAAGGRSVVGTQRNRVSADMLEYHDHGKDTLAAQKQEFLQRMAKRPIHFSDSNLFAPTGQARLPLQMLREANSKLLYKVAEIMPVPAVPLQVGSEWDIGLGGLHLKLDRFEPVGGESCAVFTDTGSRKETHLQFTFCPVSGHLAKLTFEGQYLEFDTNINEKVTLELESVQHDELPAEWLTDPATRLGTLTAFLVSKAPLPDASVMNEVLKEGSTEARALALAAYYQRGIAPSPEILPSLTTSADPEVHRIAHRFTQSVTPASQPCELPVAHYNHAKPGTTLHNMASAGFTDKPYMIHVPVDYRGDQPFPLIVYLSGGGGLAFDAALSLTNELKHAGYLVLLPHAGGELWWESKPTEMVHSLLLEVLREYNVDTNKVYVVGFSNGGTASLEYGTRWPDRFAAIASLMGAGMDSPSGTKLPMQDLLNVPVLFLHGDKDPRIPSSASYSTYETLRNLKPRVPPELHILKGRVHDVTLNTDDDLTVPFLERFTRDPFPTAVTTKLFDPKYQRQYWLEVAEGDKSVPEIEARILDGNIIDIDTHNVKKLRLLLRPELFHSSGPVHIRLNGKEQPPVELKRDCQLFQRSSESYADPFLAYTDEIVLDVSH
jgi:dienelactone hydrolase